MARPCRSRCFRSRLSLAGLPQSSFGGPERRPPKRVAPRHSVAIFLCYPRLQRGLRRSLRGLREPRFHSREPCFSSREPRFHPREPRFFIAEPIFHATEPVINPRNPCSLPENLLTRVENRVADPENYVPIAENHVFSAAKLVDAPANRVRAARDPATLSRHLRKARSNNRSLACDLRPPERQFHSLFLPGRNCPVFQQAARGIALRVSG
jgi:hypothetical protein